MKYVVKKPVFAAVAVLFMAFLIISTYRTVSQQRFTRFVNAYTQRAVSDMDAYIELNDLDNQLTEIEAKFTYEAGFNKADYLKLAEDSERLNRQAEALDVKTYCGTADFVKQQQKESFSKLWLTTDQHQYLKELQGGMSIMQGPQNYRCKEARAWVMINRVYEQLTRDEIDFKDFVRLTPTVASINEHIAKIDSLAKYADPNYRLPYETEIGEIYPSYGEAFKQKRERYAAYYRSHKAAVSGDMATYHAELARGNEINRNLVDPYLPLKETYRANQLQDNEASTKIAYANQEYLAKRLDKGWVWVKGGKVSLSTETADILMTTLFVYRADKGTAPASPDFVSLLAELRASGLYRDLPKVQDGFTYTPIGGGAQGFVFTYRDDQTNKQRTIKVKL